MIDQFFNAALPSIEQFHSIAYWLAFFAAFLETALLAGLLIPGSTLLLLLGAWLSTGNLDFAGVLWFAIAGAILGDNLNFWLGRHYGQRWTREGLWLMKPEYFDQARLFFNKHGAKSVFLGRFIPSIKEIVPFIAGTVGMRRSTFLFWNVLGSIGWGLEWIGGGYLFGQSLGLAQTWLSRIGMALFVLLLIWLLLWLVKRAVLRHGHEVLLVAVSLSRSIAKAIHDNPFVRRLAKRHPAASRFFARRVDRSHFRGLPLTLFVLAFGYVLALFAGVVEDVITADPIVALDHSIAQLVLAFRAPEIIPPFIWITALGVARVAGPVILLTCLALWLLRRQWLIAPFLVSTTGAISFALLGKFAFHRTRPMEAILLEKTWSFPSGHATIAVALYGFLGYLLIRFSDQWKTRVNLFFLTLVVILLIGGSRIALGVHYLSDVWAGYLIGALWLIIGISLSEWLTAEGHIDWNTPVKPIRRQLASGVGAIALLWYVGFTSHWQPQRHIPEPPHAATIRQPLNDFLLAHDAARTETLLGQPEQPISLAIVADSADALIANLRQIGWQSPDPLDLKSMIRLLKQGINDQTAPLSPVFWNRHINDFAMEKTLNAETKPVISTFRFWETPWRTADGKPLFVGITRNYDAIRWGLLHHIEPDIDASLDALVDSLKKTGQTRQSCRLPLMQPMTGRYLMGNPYFTRGKITLIDLTGADIDSLCDTRGAGHKSERKTEQ